MGIVSFFSQGRKTDNSGLNQNQIEKINTLRNFRSSLKAMRHNFSHNEDKLSEQKIESILGLVKEYNSNLKKAIPIFVHLDKIIAQDLDKFYISENLSFFKISQNSPHSIFSKISMTDDKLNTFIQETKNRYKLENSQNENNKKAA
jgi:hypothetical protein